MKLSFSIRNWHSLSWQELCAVAQNTRMQGIELYDLEGPVFQGKESPSNPDRAASVRRDLIGRGLEIPCVDMTRSLTDPLFDREFSACLETAVNLGVPHVAVHASLDDDGRNAAALSGV